jgi:hypothetical protein
VSLYPPQMPTRLSEDDGAIHFRYGAMSTPEDRREERRMLRRTCPHGQLMAEWSPPPWAAFAPPRDAEDAGITRISCADCESVLVSDRPEGGWLAIYSNSGRFLRFEGAHWVDPEA